jgi:G3E family GTPase
MIVEQNIKFDKVPVSIITGFLGSGKTTLLNYLTAQTNMNDIALIINEFGEVGLDNLLIESSIENTLLLENGCICCSIRGDLVDTITDLFTKVENGQIPKFNRIVIETTGLANPGPIIHSIRNERLVSKKCELGNVVTLVDGMQGADQLVKYQEVKIQISQADLCLISKCDIGLTNKISDLEEELLKINPILRIKKIKNGEVDPEFLFDTKPLNFRGVENLNQHSHKGAESFAHGAISSWSFEGSKAIDETLFSEWIKMLYTLRPFAMLRMKGIIKFKDRSQPILIQGVGSSMSKIEELNGWPSGLNQTRLILIFNGLSQRSINSSFSRWVLSE